MSIESNPEALYYSPGAVDRFAALEKTTRLRQLNHTRAIALPGVAAAAEFIQASGEQAVMTPLFGAWFDRLLAAQDFPETAANTPEIVRRVFYIGNYALTGAFLAGQEREAWVQRHQGHIMVPEIGRVALAGPEDIFVHARVDDDGIHFISEDETVHIERDSVTEQTPNWQPLRYIGPPDFRVALNDIDPNRQIFRYPAADRLSDEEHAQWHTTFCDAWDFIQEHDPEAARIVRASLTTIVPAPGEPLTHGKSMAAGAAFGVIGINERRDPERLASHIIFGTRKHLAMALRGERPDIYAPDDDPLTTKPVYPPSREGHGIAPHLLDDSFINIGLARFFSGVAATAGPDIQEYAQLSFARWFVESQQNMRGLRDSGYVTNGNAAVVAALQNELADLADHYNRTPERLKRVIATNVFDRHISWRLHNITPHPQAVHYLRDVWLRGEPCPPLAVPGELSPSIAAYTHSGQRTRYVLKESSIKEPALFAALLQGNHDPQRFGEPTPGDIAFASGDIREARTYFTAAVYQNARNPEAWAGFALTFEHDTSAAAAALRHAPELVAAVFAAIGDAGVQPEHVARWVANCRTVTAIDA